MENISLETIYSQDENKDSGSLQAPDKLWWRADLGRADLELGWYQKSKIAPMLS